MGWYFQKEAACTYSVHTVHTHVAKGLEGEDISTKKFSYGV